MAIDLIPSDGGVRLSGAGLDNGPVPFLIVARVRRDSAGGETSGHVFSEQNGKIRLGTRDDTTLNLISARLGTNDNQMRLTVPASGGAPITLAILRGDTPGDTNSRHAYYLDGAAGSFTTVNAGISFESSTGGDTGIGFRFGRSQGWDGAIEYLWIWRDVDPSDELLRALSAGLHPALSGLPRPALAVEFPGAVRLLTEQSIVSNDNSGYEALGGYKAWPTAPQFFGDTAAPPAAPTEDTNYTGALMQPLISSIGLGLGV